MDITSYVASQRESGLLQGDYNAYRAQATRRILSLRRRLGQATPKGRKYSPKSPITADDIQHDNEFVYLLLMSAERAWAAAMAMKSAQSSENTQKKMVGSTKKQIVSRLSKAIQYAKHLFSCLKDSATSRASDTDNMEAAAYLASLQGSLHFEKARWDQCIQQYSVSRLVYATLSAGTRTDIFRDLLGSIVDPSIRYAAYQLRFPRTKAVPDIATEHFPAEEGRLRAQIESRNPDAFLNSENAGLHGKTAQDDVPTKISWRQRTVKIEDATIAHAIAGAIRKERELSQIYVKKNRDSRELATAYDDVIEARQEAVDATKSALDELMAEGVDMSDPRVQSLQLTRTAVNYAVIELRIGRNRVLCSHYDDTSGDHIRSKRSRRPIKDSKVVGVKRQGTGITLAKFREEVALYDSILQNIDAIKDLSGVAGDVGFMEELSCKRAYFRALKCLTIGRSHALMGQTKNALALYSRALELASDALSSNSTANIEAGNGPPKLEVGSKVLQSFRQYLDGLVSQFRALVELKNLLGQEKAAMNGIHRLPLAERLEQYPTEDVDLSGLVNFPLKLRPIPVKPLFFDLAWNYIDYPDRARSGVNGTPTASKTIPEEKKEPAKKGWFGFGR